MSRMKLWILKKKMGTHIWWWIYLAIKMARVEYPTSLVNFIWFHLLQREECWILSWTIFKPNVTHQKCISSSRREGIFQSFADPKHMVVALLHIITWICLTLREEKDLKNSTGTCTGTHIPGIPFFLATYKVARNFIGKKWGKIFQQHTPSNLSWETHLHFGEAPWNHHHFTCLICPTLQIPEKNLAFCVLKTPENGWGLEVGRDGWSFTIMCIIAAVFFSKDFKFLKNTNQLSGKNTKKKTVAFVLRVFFQVPRNIPQ